MRHILLVTILLLAVGTPAAAAADNEAPLPDAGLDQRVEQGATVLLDGTGSRDPDGEIAGYEWSIEAPDGAQITPECPTCPKTTFIAAQAGRYAVTVAVTDGDGTTRTDTLYVYVDGGGSSAAPPSEPSGPGDIDTSPGIPPSLSGPTFDPAPTTGGSDRGWDPPPMFSITCPPEVRVGEPAGCTAATARLDAPLSFAWSNGASGPTASYTWNSAGTKTVIATVEDADGTTLIDEARIRVVDNRPPRVEIRTPESIVPGRELTLTTKVKEDPDGTIVDTEWTPGRTVRVPDQGELLTVTVTVVDDDGATASDSISLEGTKVTRTQEGKALVFCYYTRAAQKKRGNPHHCEVTTGGGPGKDGYSSSGSRYRNLYSQYPDRYRVVWKKVPAGQLTENGTVAGEPSDMNESAYETTGVEGTSAYSVEYEDQTKLSGRSRTTTETSTSIRTTDPYTLNGKTVSSDLTGDGEIDAADWDERYGSAGQSGSDLENVMATWRDVQGTLGQVESSTGSDETSGNADVGTDGPTPGPNIPEL